VFFLIEKYCPNLVARVPGLAEAGYIYRMANPDPLPTRVLGIQLNPKKHFLEPRFSEYPEGSPGRVYNRKTKRMREEPPVYLADIITSDRLSLLVGAELSGKSYLLGRICYLVADKGHIPVLVNGRALAEAASLTAPELLAKHLIWYTDEALATPDGRKIYLLIDDADDLSKEQITLLRNTAHEQVSIILTGKVEKSHDGFKTYYIAGIKASSVERFVRSLDVSRTTDTSLVDRTLQYVGRTFGTSGLPVNTFTVSMMLEECRISERSLATPTMGRLIERFIDGQLGSYADTMRVDFETKNHFLTTLAGSGQPVLEADSFRRKLTKYISMHGHPHSVDAFEKDLIESGVLEKNDDDRTVQWSRPIFLDFFWIRNMVRERKLKVLSKRLLSGMAASEAAIIGSQMTNVSPVLHDLLKDVCDQPWMRTSRQGALKSEDISYGRAWTMTDDEEDAVLRDIETKVEQDISEQESEVRGLTPKGSEKVKLDNDINEAMDKDVSKYGLTMMQERHFLVTNVAAILVNARSLSREDKEKAVMCVLRSNLWISKYVSELFRKLSKGKIPPQIAAFLGRFLGLAVNDRMIGDPFLVDVFKGLSKSARSIDDTLAIIDLLIVCGGAAPNAFIKVLKKHRDAADVQAAYARLVTAYYFRFHNQDEKTKLREAMKEVRTLAGGLRLPPVD
jgi:hypothetical protein